jgi:DNA-binding NtrC family response regulator
MQQSAVVRLLDEGRLGRAVSVLNANPTPDLNDQVMLVFLEGIVGSRQQAALSGGRLLSRRLNNLQRAQCLETTAWAAPPLEALQKLRHARELVSKAGQVEQARFAARYGRALLNLVGVEAAYVELPGIRKTVLAAADVQASVELHLLTAETEAKRNKRTRSSTHLRIAETLLKETGNVFQMARLQHIKSHLAAFAADLTTALDAAHENAKHAEEAGWSLGLGVALGNIAYWKLALGDLEGAEEFILRSLRHVSGSKNFELGSKDTCLQILIAKGASVANERAEQLWNDEFAGEWRHSYYGLWHHLTRAKLFLQAADVEKARRLIRDVLPVIRKNAETHLVNRMSLLEAEIDATTGHRLDAAMLIGNVYDADDELPFELFAEIQKLFGLVMLGSNQARADRCFARAGRLFSGAGLALAQTALNQSIARNKGVSQIQGASRANGDERPLLNGEDVVHALSAIVHLVRTPEQCGDEIVDLVNELNVAETVGLAKANENGVWAPASITNPDVGGLFRGQLMHIYLDTDQKTAVVVRPRQIGECVATLVALKHLVHAAVEAEAARLKRREAAPLWPEESPEQILGMIVASENMLQLVDICRRLASSPLTILITGETGTGKELLARALHDASLRKDKPFMPFNCSAVAREMLDAQLFGYRRGAFTGAQDAFQGIIRTATGGTLFLDEIGELTPDVQPKLLRFLESGEIHPLGEPKPIAVNVRVVAATNANLEQLVKEGRFREDLFYRLNVLPLHVPPLRARREEIPLLVQHYVDRASRESQKTRIRVSEEAMEYLMIYKWPGNIRQLANEIRRMVALAETGAMLMPEHLSPDIKAGRRTIPTSDRELAPTELVVRLDQPISAAMEHIERSMIQYAMKLAGGRVEDAAQQLGLSRKGLYLKRQRLAIEANAVRERQAAQSQSELSV